MRWLSQSVRSWGHLSTFQEKVFRIAVPQLISSAVLFDFSMITYISIEKILKYRCEKLDSLPIFTVIWFLIFQDFSFHKNYIQFNFSWVLAFMSNIFPFCYIWKLIKENKKINQIWCKTYWNDGAWKLIFSELFVLLNLNRNDDDIFFIEQLVK